MDSEKAGFSLYVVLGILSVAVFIILSINVWVSVSSCCNVMFWTLGRGREARSSLKLDQSAWLKLNLRGAGIIIGLELI